MSTPVHCTGTDVDVSLSGLMVHFEKFDLSIEDGMQAAKTRGVPNGYTNGEVGAAGSVEVDTANLNIIIDAAASAGSFQDLEPFDIDAVATTVNQQLRVQAFDCKLAAEDILAAEANSSDKLKHKIRFEVTSPDFVRLNGVPYLSASRTATL